jgi:subtilisin family serine protease
VDVNSPAAVQYRTQLQQQQQAALQQIQQMFPAAQQQRGYQVVVNGMALALPEATPADLERLRALPQVAEVYPDLHYDMHMFSSLPQIGAPELWQHPDIGGQANAGAGIKIAVLDSGIAIDNPFFDPSGFSYPEGYPQGDTNFTTPKVIVSRVYTRPFAAPLPGSDTPVPGPEDASHGTHVAGIAAGNANTQATIAGVTETISGVAPQAYLMNYKVFYANESIFSGAFTAELIAALEDAVVDGADVINNSWGGRADVDPRFDLITQAAAAAVDAGVIVVFAGGNEGPDPSTAGSPAYSDRVISVGAASKPAAISAGFVDIVGPENIPEALTGNNYTIAGFGSLITGEVFGPAPYLPVLVQDGTGLACDPLPEGSLAGQIALIERGVCEFSLKAYNAQQAGATAAIVYNSEAGGDTLISMAPGARAEEVIIPAIFVARSTGVGMLNWYSDVGPAALVQIDPRGRIIEQTPDVLTEFSSRGPTFQGSLKPDIVAPGASILSAGNTPGAEGLAQHLGFGLSSGTSMAAPHVAGGAALLRQVHPDWTTSDVKSALMSTADRTVWLDEEQTIPASVLDEGAGRVNLARAVDPGLLFDSPSLSFGTLKPTPGQPTRATLSVTARNITGATQTYSLTAAPSDGPEFGISVAPAEITVGPQELATFTVSIEIPADTPPSDYGALVELNGPQSLHLPVWARTLPADFSTKVLLIDNDGSTSLGLRDYSGYYAEALRELGVSLTYLDVDALAPAEQTLPDIGELQQHEIIIWFTGDNFVPSGALAVPTPLTPADQNLLIAYLQSGGNLIATGQDLTDASDIEQLPPDDRYGRSDLYHAYLGARWVQDDAFAALENTERVVVGIGTEPWTTDMELDLSLLAEGIIPSAQTGAGNQESIDEITVVDADPRLVDEYTTPIFRTISATDQELGPDDSLAGIVGLTRADEPTLEEPELALPYRSIYLSFGLEGVRNDTGLNTRKELLQHLLWWTVDQPAVTLDPAIATVTEPGQAVTFTANPTTNTPTEFVRFRWDFGDGSRIVQTAEPVVTHEYAAPGAYPVRVEATNAWEHRAVSETLPVAQPNSSGEYTPQAATTPETTDLQPVTFAETGQTLEGRFLSFWQQHGGLPVFGYPTTPQQSGEHISQGFERTRFELHPENAAPYDVLLGRVGVETLEAQGRDWRTFATVDSAPEGCLYFAETQHSLCGAFKAYWESHGLEFDGQQGSSYAESLALFGLPISEPMEETLADGSVRTVQWFERARFEYHPENDAPYDVLLGLLGSSTR